MERKKYTELFHGKTCPVIISTVQNIFYTIGFSTTAKRPFQIGLNCVVMTADHTYFIFPENWEPLVRTQIGGLEKEGAIQLVTYKGKVQELADKIYEIVGHSRQIGFEQDGMEVGLYLAVQQLMDENKKKFEWVNVSEDLNRARLIKGAKEILALRDSANVAKKAMEYAKTILKPGKKEIEIVAELEYFMRKQGSEGVPFTMKVLAGENAVRTVNLPGENVIQKGDIVLLDFGAVVSHYASDWTRSFAIGSVTEEQQMLYDLVWKIERECISMVEPGTNYKDLMDKAFEILAGHPYENYFNPYLGHSIGISSQENPVIVPGADLVLKENMIITIEPGIYVPGIGGVRIEDEVLVTENGHEILTGLNQEEFLLK